MLPPGHVACHTGDAELIAYAKANCYFTYNISHQWLLPQCCCSVHHGGAGTTVAARPSASCSLQASALNTAGEMRLRLYHGRRKS